MSRPLAESQGSVFWGDIHVPVGGPAMGKHGAEMDGCPSGEGGDTSGAELYDTIGTGLHAHPAHRAEDREGAPRR